MAMACVNGGKECDVCERCWPDTKMPVCPVCGKETDTFYVDKENEIVGCDRCVHVRYEL